MDSEEQSDDKPDQADQTLPADPSSPLQTGASQLHEMYQSYLAAGFTRREALDIVIGILTHKND